jgi:hypothetical protein
VNEERESTVDLNVIPTAVADAVQIGGGICVILLFAGAYVWSQLPERPARKHRRRRRRP